MDTRPRSETLARYRWWSTSGDLPNDKEMVRMILQRHRGSRHPITSRQLAGEVHISTRQVRNLIAELVKDGELIGASVDGDNGGYFMIQNLAELEETRAILRARASEIFQRDRVLCHTWNKHHAGELQPLLPNMEVGVAHA